MITSHYNLLILRLKQNGLGSSSIIGSLYTYILKSHSYVEFEEIRTILRPSLLENMVYLFLFLTTII